MYSGFGFLEFENPFYSGFALFRPYNSFSGGDELYRVLDPSYHSRIGIDGTTTFFSVPFLSGEQLVTGGYPYLTASYYCQNYASELLSLELGQDLTTGDNTVYYDYSTSGWVSSLGGQSYEYIYCYVEPSYTYEQAVLNLTYSTYVFSQHQLFVTITFFFFIFIYLFFEKIFSGGKK